MDTSKVTRVEVIDHTNPPKGRAYIFDQRVEKTPVRVEVVLQDDGRTLKVFLS